MSNGCVEVASSIEEMQNKFDVVFGDMRNEVDKWAQEYSDAIGRNKNDIKTYLADQQNLLVGFGMTRQAGAEMAEQMTSLALDLASYGNMDETASVNAMTKAVMGESEAAKTLGAVLNDSTRAQAMATLGLKGTYDKLDQLTKMQVNYQAILQQSPDAIGDCQRSLDSYESTKKRYIAKLKEIKTIVGQFFLPTYQKILSIGAKGLTMIRDWLQKLTDLTDKLGGSQRVLSVLAAAFTAMLVAMNLKKIGAAINGFTKLARAIGLGHGKALAFFAVFLLLALVIEDFISFMRGDKSLLGTMLERAGVDCEKLRQNIVGVWTKIKQAMRLIAKSIVRDIHAANGKMFQTEYEERLRLLGVVLDECSWLNENIQLVLNDGVISISKSAVWTRKVQDVKNMVLSWKQKDTARAEKLREQARQAELKQQAAMVKAIVRELLKEQEKSRYPAGSPLDIGCDSNRPPSGGSALRTATTSTTPCTSTPMATGTTTTAPTRTASAPL